MRKLSLIGIETGELPWLRVVVALLRHPDPSVAELTRQALIYLGNAAGERAILRGDSLDHTG
jgi:hypothetical protein